MEEWPLSHGSTRTVNSPGNLLVRFSGAKGGEKVRRKVVSALSCCIFRDIVSSPPAQTKELENASLLSYLGRNERRPRANNANYFLASCVRGGSSIAKHVDKKSVICKIIGIQSVQ